MVLGRSESVRFRRAFDRADVAGNGELTTADAVRAYRELGGKATETEVCNNNPKLSDEKGSQPRCQSSRVSVVTPRDALI